MDRLALAKHNPRHFCERLAGRAEYKVRIGDYRAIVEIWPGVIKVLYVDHRENVYGRLRRQG